MFQQINKYDLGDDLWVTILMSSYLDQEITVFSETMKAFVPEWLELFSDDVIYFEDEIELLKNKPISKLGMVRLHNKKKRSAEEFIRLHLNNFEK